MPQSHVHHIKTPHERWVGLWIHVAVFLIVNAGLTTLNLTQQPDKLWFYWPLCGWGLGLVLHAWTVYRKRELKQST